MSMNPAAVNDQLAGSTLTHGPCPSPVLPTGPSPPTLPEVQPRLAVSAENIPPSSSSVNLGWRCSSEQAAAFASTLRILRRQPCLALKPFRTGAQRAAVLQHQSNVLVLAPIDANRSHLERSGGRLRCVLRVGSCRGETR
jgi:hypothetical protein